MSKINGNKVLLFVDDVAIGCLTGCNITMDSEEIVSTCKDNDGQKTTIDGGDSWSIDFDGNFETSSTLGLSQLIDLKQSKATFYVRFGLDTSGGLYLTGQGWLQSLKWDGPLNAMSKFTGKISPRSALTKGTHT